MKKYLAIIAMSCGFLVFSNSAEARQARCDITNKYDNSRYQGPCDFIAGKGGSFELGAPESAAVKLGMMFPIYIEVTKPGRGYLQVYKSSEDIYRDPKQPACWTNETIRICVY